MRHQILTCSDCVKTQQGSRLSYAFSALVAIEPGAVAYLALVNERNTLFRG